MPLAYYEHEQATFYVNLGKPHLRRGVAALAHHEAGHAAMALLTTSADPEVGIEEQIKACFLMFDTRNDGRQRSLGRPLRS